MDPKIEPMSPSQELILIDTEMKEETDFDYFAERRAEDTKICEETPYKHHTPDQDLDHEIAKLEVTKNLVHIRRLFDVLTPLATRAAVAGNDWKYGWFFDNTLRMYITTYISDHLVRHPGRPVNLMELQRTIPLVTSDQIRPHYCVLASHMQAHI
ncbi:hypothetical protein KEM56_001742, partial [Ascosphaera pollenicola]